MKKKIILLFSCVFLGVILMTVFLLPVRPVVIIKNNTRESLYIFAGESILGVEPEPDEVETIVKSKPEVLLPGKKLKLTASFTSLIKKDATIDIGWRMGGPYEYNSTGGGGQNFLLSSTEGACSVSIEIQEGSDTNTLKNAPGDFCFKKIKSFHYKY